MTELIAQHANGYVPLPEGEDIIITTGPLGGLGDHLIFSTLPERFHALGRRVYLDKDIEARNDNILDAVWGRNPYIIGTTDRKPNAGYVRQGLFYEIANRYPIGCIEAMERAHGLPGPYNMAPRIYYTPKPFHLEGVDLATTVLMDFSAVSSKMGDRGISDAIRVMRGRFRNAPLVQLFFPSHVTLEPPRITASSYMVSSIEEYLDILYAARAWIGSEAGGQSLAALARGEHDVHDLDARPEVVATLCAPTFNSRGYTYRGVDYRVTTDTNVGGDYFFPHELQAHTYALQTKISIAERRLRAQRA